jgi:hypothetical protein
MREAAPPLGAYPPSQPAPRRHWQRPWPEEALPPALGPVALARVPAEVLHVPPGPGGVVAVLAVLAVLGEDGDGRGGGWRRSAGARAPVPLGLGPRGAG